MPLNDKCKLENWRIHFIVVDSAFGSFHQVSLGSIAYASEVHAASMFRVLLVLSTFARRRNPREE
jgi:hypothetical protein